MIRILLTLIMIGVILLVAFYQFKEKPLKKRMLVTGSIAVAALIASFLQFLNFAIYIPLLAIVAISMIGAIAYAKLDEAEKVEKQLVAQERKQRQQEARLVTSAPVKESVSLKKVNTVKTEEPEEKLFAMQTIGAGREER